MVTHLWPPFPISISNPQLGLAGEFDKVTTAVDMLMQCFDAPSAESRRFAVKWHDIYGPRNLSYPAFVLFMFYIKAPVIRGA
jgi:hypothetical protein